MPTKNALGRKVVRFLDGKVVKMTTFLVIPYEVLRALWPNFTKFSGFTDIPGTCLGTPPGHVPGYHPGTCPVPGFYPKNGQNTGILTLKWPNMAILTLKMAKYGHFRP